MRKNGIYQHPYSKFWKKNNRLIYKRHHISITPVFKPLEMLSNLKEKLKNAEGITSNVPSTTELQSKEDAYRKTIAEADSLLSKMETEYQTTIKVCSS